MNNSKNFVGKVIRDGGKYRLRWFFKNEINLLVS